MRRSWLLAALCALGAIMPFYMLWGHGGAGTDHQIIWEAAKSRRPYSIWFPYPPIVLPFLQPFGLLPLNVSFSLFNLLGVTAFAVAARSYTPWWPVVPLLPGSLMCVAYGQTGLIVGALWLLAFRRRAPAVAALAIKPHLSFLAVLNLRSWHDWRMATLCLLLLCLLPVALYGYEIWFQWLARSREMTKLIMAWDRWTYIAVSPFLQWGLIPWAATAIGAVYLLTKRFDVFTAATAAPIIAPYSFIYDLPVASLGLVLAAMAEKRPVRIVVLAVAVLAPNIVIFKSQWVPAAMLAALWVQVRAIPSTSWGNRSAKACD